MYSELKDKKIDITERTVAYSLRIIKLYRELEKDDIGCILGKQTVRSGTSIGANIHEAQGGQSKADFIAKISVAYKEARETAYWLRIIKEAKLITPLRLTDLVNETEQIIKIIASILLTAKQKNRI